MPDGIKGNSQQRRKARKLLAKLGFTATAKTPLPEMAKTNAQLPKAEPATEETASSSQLWYESTLLWGAFGIAIGIVLLVLGAVMRDQRWLLFPSWPFLGLTCWALFRRVKSGLWRLGLVTLSSVVCAAGLYELYARLPNPDANAGSAGPMGTQQQRAPTQPDGTNQKALVVEGAKKGAIVSGAVIQGDNGLNQTGITLKDSPNSQINDADISGIDHAIDVNKSENTKINKPKIRRDEHKK